MADQKKEWTYYDEEKGEWISPHLTLEELDARRAQGRIEEHTHCVNVRLSQRAGIRGSQGVPYSMISRVEVEFDPPTETFFTSRAGRPTTILAGPNNGGKTLLLKHLFSQVGHGGYLLGCNRFSHVDVLNSRQLEEHEHRRYYENFIHNFQMSNQNTEENELNLERVMTGLKNRQRARLFELAESLIPNKFTMERTDTENDFSPFQVRMDGRSLRYASSGTRLLLTLLGVLLDERFTTVLVDEPEIGLSPRIQTTLARFLYDAQERKNHFPHLKQLYVATHSHLFLDTVLSNNHVVKKGGNRITVEEVKTVSALHDLQFNLLGNDLESLFLPAAIVIVEGVSDVTFFKKVIQLHIPDRKVAVASAEGEGGIEQRLYFFVQAFGDIVRSPYRDRLFVAYDKKISLKPGHLEKYGVLAENVGKWSKNGIEYYYPPELMAEGFSCDITEVPTINIEKDKNQIDHKEIRVTKKELAAFVAERLTVKHALHAEIQPFVDRIKAICK